MASPIAVVTVEINGQDFDNFKEYSENARTVGVPVKYMDKRGTVKTTPLYGFSLDVVLDKNENYDFLEEIENATVTIDYKNGDKTIFLRCQTTEIGEGRATGEEEITYTVEFNAGDRKRESA
jgi:hypothetical protein